MATSSSQSDNESNTVKKKRLSIKRDDAVAESLGSLFMDEATSDITLIVEGRRFPGHKAVLSARCEYFKALFYNGMQESAQNEVELKGHGNLKKDIFEPILKYIYSGTMDVESKEKDTIMEILSEAHFFSMSELVGEILAYLKEAHKDNLIKWAFQMLQFAETHSNNTLKEECFKELEVDPDTAILDGEAMSELSQNSFEELISRDSFWALEENILTAVLERIDKERTRDGLTSEQCAEKFRSLTGAIRLQQLSVETLESLRESPFFTADQVLDAMFLRTSQCHLKRRDRGIEEPLPEKREHLRNVVMTQLQKPIFFESLIYKSPQKGKTFVFTLPRQGIINVVQIHWYKSIKCSFCIEVSVRKNDWKMVVDMRDYALSYRIPIYFQARAARQIRVTMAYDNLEVNNKMMAKHVGFTCRYGASATICKPDAFGNLFIDPIRKSKFLKMYLEVVLPTEPQAKIMLNGSLEHTLTTGFTHHKIIASQHNYQTYSIPRPYTDGRIILATNGVFWADKFRFLLPTGGLQLGEQPDFQYRVYVSNDAIFWERVCDRSEIPSRGWQTVTFTERPLAYIMLEGVDSTLMVNGVKTFAVVQFEWVLPEDTPQIEASSS